MEIIVFFLIFLLFYWNIFVILRQLFKIRNNMFTNLQVVVLKHLADGEQHEEAPAGLTDAQFRVALSELKACDMVKVNVDEVGEVISSQIKTKGRAALDNWKSLEKAMLNHILEEKKLTKYSYEILVYYKKNTEKLKNIFEGEKTNREILAIAKSLLKLKLLACERDTPDLYTTDEGLQLLDDIEYLLDKERATWYESKSMENTHDSVTNNIIHLDPKSRKNMKKFIITTCNYGFYKDENGKPYNLEDVMNAYALFLGDDKFKDYSSLVNKSGELEDKELIDELLPIFYNSVPDVISFLGEIDGISNNPEIVKVAADYVNNRKISEQSSRSDLWKVLKKHGLYKPSYSNWCNYINKDI
ncbi:hypothetical protein DWV76_01030 [Segatella copri]|jgi:hypothetical protein|uniref:Uncharacterized protein n=1 Tax=Segatella copri TaxID=165179 RepID=A0AA92TZS7_9BACT|nr:hypothetical protein [Segatella copri]RGW45133.1 hypothetical protein DWV76_01030 [Segatella copri]